MDYKEVKEIFLKNSSLYFSSNYPKDFLKRVLDLYIEYLPFYYKPNELFYVLSLSPYGSIYIVYMWGKELKIIYPLIHSYLLSKTYGKAVLGMTKEKTPLMKSLLKNKWIENLSEVWQLCIVSPQHLFVGEKPEKTIYISYVRDIIPFEERLRGIKTTPFWIEVFCLDSDKTSCIDRILTNIGRKGIVSIYGEKELLKELKHLLEIDFSVALDKFFTYHFKNDKLREFERKFRDKWKDTSVYFNPFRKEFFPLK